jgi:hypothetical protein
MRRLVLIAAAACATPPATGSGGRVPLRLDQRGSGSVRMAATIEIGGVALDAFVDTGSSGLRVMPGVLDDSAYDAISDELVEFSYHSGLAIGGVVATAPVTIGGLTTPPIAIEAVRSVGCTPELPQCDTAGFGYPAILGIGMRNLPGSGGIANPIVQLDGHPAFAVHARRGASSGMLTIAPDSDGYELTDVPLEAGGEPLADGSPARDDRTVPTCVVDETHGMTICAGGILDTGCGPTELLRPSYTGANEMWSPGTEVEVTTAALSYSFTIGAMPVPGVDEVLLEPRPNHTVDMINVGTAAFFHADVLFDQAGGRIGIKTAS